MRSTTLDRLKKLLASPRFPWMAAALAALLFAWDDAHAFVVAWISCRMWQGCARRSWRPAEAASPRRIQIHFDAPLDDPATVWVTWVGQGSVPFKPPRRGEKVTVPSASLPEALMGQKP